MISGTAFTFVIWKVGNVSLSPIIMRRRTEAIIRLLRPSNEGLATTWKQGKDMPHPG